MHPELSPDGNTTDLFDFLGVKKTNTQEEQEVEISIPFEDLKSGEKTVISLTPKKRGKPTPTSTPVKSLSRR